MAKNTIIVRVLGDTKNFVGQMGKAQGILGKFGTGAGIAATTAAIAVGGFAASSVSDFAKFEKGMNEVYTLMPGISQQAMGAMQGDVKKFATDFSVLPKDVVPALYDSLSAGVPPGNVFDFLETAQKAAKGGVTELSTSVDGISSVVNAFGSDVIDAGQASDLMFTAVRLGKTTFGEMSASMSNVAPVAAALGVEFGDVTAGLSVLTAQGVPTAQATTQMRSAFAELGKTGSVADKAFQELAGKSFPQFIAEGGNVQQAFQLMSSGAEANGSSLIDMFGSIEAGQAVMALTKNGGEAFAASLTEMQNSAGATDAAYATMNQGLSASLDKLKSAWSVGKLEVGEAIAPIVESLATALPGAITSSVAAFSAFSSAAKPVGQWFATALPPALSAAKGAFDSFAGPVSTAVNALTTFGGWILSNWQPVVGGLVAGAIAMTPALISLAAGFGLQAAAAAASAISTAAALAPFIAIGAAIFAVGAGFVLAYQKIDWFRAAVDGVVAWARDTAWPVIKVAFTGIKTAVTTSISAVRGAISSATNWIQARWAQWGDTITAVARGTWNYISTQIGNVMTVIRGVIKTVTSLIRGDWKGALDGIKQIGSGAFNYLRTAVTTAFKAIRTIATASFRAMVSAIKSLGSGLIDWFAALPGRIVTGIGALNSLLISKGLDLLHGLKNGAVSGWNTARSWITSIPSLVVSAIGSVNSTLLSKGTDLLNGLKTGADAGWNTARSWLTGLPAQAVSAVGSLGSTLYSAGVDLMQGMINGVQSMASRIKDAALAPVKNAVGAVKGFLGIESPSKLFRQIGEFTGEGMVIGIDAMTRPVNQAMLGMIAPPDALDGRRALDGFRRSLTAWGDDQKDLSISATLDPAGHRLGRQAIAAGGQAGTTINVHFHGDLHVPDKAAAEDLVDELIAGLQLAGLAP